MKIRVRQVHWNFQNPPRKTQSHQNYDFLGILGTLRDTVYPWGGGANEQKTNKRKNEFVWSKQDLRRNSRRFRECFSVRSTLLLRAETRGPQKILLSFGEKAHTSKRVSVIVPDNVISKVQCAPRTLGFSEPTKNPKNPSNSRRF